MAVMLIIIGLMIFPSEEMAEFRKHSNGNANYVWVEAVECETGLKESGYSFAPSGRVVMKQVNDDGSVGKVCIK